MTAIDKFTVQDRAIEIIGMAMSTDQPSSFEQSCIKMVGSDMSKAAAQKVYQATGLSGTICLCYVTMPSPRCSSD